MIFRLLWVIDPAIPCFSLTINISTFLVWKKSGTSLSILTATTFCHLWPSTSVQAVLAAFCNSGFLSDSPHGHEIFSWFFSRYSQFKHLHLVTHCLLFKTEGQGDFISFVTGTHNRWLLDFAFRPQPQIPATVFCDNSHSGLSGSGEYSLLKLLR